MPMPRWLSILVLVPFLACGGSKKDTKTAKNTQTNANTAPVAKAVAADRTRCSSAGKRIVKLDLNRDKQPDVFKLYEKKIVNGETIEVLSCKEVDLNFDGRKDVWNYYDDQGNLRMEEWDLDFDGRIDMTTHRKSGKIHTQELDTNYDKKPDIWRRYEDGVLIRVERDSNNDGRIDYREFYEGGRLDRINYDKDGDGRMESWDRLPSEGGKTPEPEKEEAPSK